MHLPLLFFTLSLMWLVASGLAHSGHDITYLVIFLSIPTIPAVLWFIYIVLWVIFEDEIGNYKMRKLRREINKQREALTKDKNLL